jgi:hypothetical protein
MMSAGVAGCADSGRFGDPSFSLNGGAPEMTSAIPPAQSAPVARVESRPLGGTQVSSAQGYNPPPAYNPPAYNPPAYNPPPAQPAAYNPPPRYNNPPPSYQPVPARVSSAAPSQHSASPRVAEHKPEKTKKVAEAAPTKRDLAPKNLGTLHTSAPQKKVASAPAAPPPAAAKPTRVASLGPVATARVAKTGDDDIAETKETHASATGASPNFRWPVRGRVIAGFGPKPSGQQNDGINLAVPEGTSVKAAEDGVVAYAGNELKGYGNLVLVRHNNGYVTAYAHASELKVKRGDKVTRGQIIALAGQTGGVSSPQLHFEIRKGSTPVDPIQLMANI